jgi:hypothetical protein
MLPVKVIGEPGSADAAKFASSTTATRVSVIVICALPAESTLNTADGSSAETVVSRTIENTMAKNLLIILVFASLIYRIPNKSGKKLAIFKRGITCLSPVNNP